MSAVQHNPAQPASQWAVVIRAAMGKQIEQAKDIDAERIVGSAEAAEADRQLDEFLNVSPVRAFMNVVRQHPGIAGWFSSNIANWEFGPDTEHAAAIRQLLGRRDVSRHLAMKYVTGSGRDLEISNLLNVAEHNIEDDDERLDRRWHDVYASPIWDKLSRSKRLQRIAQDFYALLHAVSAERSKYGGPNVQITLRAAAALIEMTHDYPCDFRDVGKAAHVLLRSGLLPAITAGRSIVSGETPRTTIYHLLPQPRTATSPYCGGKGLVPVGSGAADRYSKVATPPGDEIQVDRPRLADPQRHVLLAFFSGSEDSARQVIENWKNRQLRQPDNHKLHQPIPAHWESVWQHSAIAPLGQVEDPEQEAVQDEHNPGAGRWRDGGPPAHAAVC